MPGVEKNSKFASEKSSKVLDTRQNAQSLRGGYALLKDSLGEKLGVLFGTFVIMLFVTSAVSGWIGGIIPGRDAILAGSLLQGLFCFILPAWLTAFLCFRNVSHYLGTGIGLTWRQSAGVMFLLAVMTPAMNALVSWNESLHLPASLSEFENIFRRLEDSAADTTALLLGDNSVWGLVSGVLVVGIFTGIAEETFFRAGLQRAMTTSRINPHVAIWCSAFIFSAIHFQFYGFVPRLILGALFGYIYHYSGSLWLAAFAHAFNNSSVVVCQWLAGNGIDLSFFENIGVEGSGAEVWTIVSVCVSMAFVCFCWKRVINYNSARNNKGGKEESRYIGQNHNQ